MGLDQLYIGPKIRNEIFVCAILGYFKYHDF